MAFFVLLKHRIDQNEEKKFVQTLKEMHAKELKHFINESNNEYKRKKEDVKKVCVIVSFIFLFLIDFLLLMLKVNPFNIKDLALKAMSTRDRDEHIKQAKERLHEERKLKEEDKRKKQEIQLNEELCKLKRKHLIMFHKLECDIDTMVCVIKRCYPPFLSYFLSPLPLSLKIFLKFHFLIKRK